MRGAAVLSLLYLTTVPKEGKMFLFLKDQCTPEKQYHFSAACELILYVAETSIKYGL
jgi:hypothetical protein